MDNFIITIPARYSSSRLPGKPLKLINGKTMLLRVWEKCIKATKDNSKVVVLTDDNRIIHHCIENNINFYKTSKTCKTGSDRIYEFAKNNKFRSYINVQGDEPFVNTNDIKKIIQLSTKKNIVMNFMTLAKTEEYKKLTIPKVAFNNKYDLIYMSRSIIPIDKYGYISHKIYKQVCIYSYPYKDIIKFGQYRKKTYLEHIEDIELLRFIEIGIKVKMIITKNYSIAVDTVYDLKKAIKYARQKD
jgi:3-deoxy-manno-octulosonate cytidylyltransferase (CMP-KDO synthetase)